MNWYVVLHAFNSSGHNLFKSISITNADLEKLRQWSFDHQKGREFVKNSFGNIHCEWDINDPNELPAPDFPSSYNSKGSFSQKAIDALSFLLIEHGDLHLLIMATGERYFIFDCWSFVEAISFERAKFSDGGHVKLIDIKGDTSLPDIFRVNRKPDLIVNDKFKNAAENAGLTGMVFAPIKINRIKAT